MAERIAGTVLLVDDHPLIRTLTEGILKSAGYAVEHAECGTDALKRLRRGGIDAVLLDLELSDMDGYTVSRTWRTEEKGGRVALIALTANGRAEDRAACLEAGMDDHLTKPVVIDRLLGVLSRNLGRDRPQPGATSGVTIALMGANRKELEKPPTVRFPTPRPGAPPLVDQEVWSRLHAETKHTDPTLVNDLLRQFLDQCPRMIEAIAEALKAKDLERARSGAHRLQGSAATIGLMALGETAARCEKLLKNADHEGSATVLNELRAAMVRTLEAPALRQRLAK